MNSSRNPNSLPIPNRIAHYRIVKKLGQGGMSIVYEGLDERLKRPVAIKILHPFLASIVSYRERFFREAQAVARLMHPNIVQIFDVSNLNNNEEQLYIVTELLVGFTLKEFSERINLIEMPELSAAIVMKICHAVDHAHQKGIVHRDIKPENIMVSRLGQLKLMDFGIASIGSEESITQSGTLLGSLAHVSPEIIKGARATLASDIFSLATVFYFLLSKELPFSNTSPHALLKAIVDDEPKPIRELSPYVSDDLADIVEIGMKKEPQARFSSAVLMAEAIQKSLDKMGINIDDKLLETTLKDPEIAVSHFQAVIEGQLKKKLELSEREKNDRLVLALMCRLEAQPTLKAVPKKVEQKAKRFIIGSIGFFSAPILAFWLFTLLSPKNTDDDGIFYNAPKQGEVIINQTVDASTASLFSDEEEIIKENIQEKQIPPAGGPTFFPEQAKKIKEEELFLVDITVWPFATINVDGIIVAKDKKSLRLKLTKGPHKIIFTHIYAATVEKNIFVKDIKKPMQIQVSLSKSKPAFLIVKSEHGGDIAVDGSYKGTTEKSQMHPIVIPFPEKSHEQKKEVIVSQKNFQPYIAETEFIAGQIKEIEVKLRPL